MRSVFTSSVFFTLPLGILMKLHNVSLYSKKTEAQKTMQFAYSNTNAGLSNTKVPAGSLLWYLVFFHRT